MKFKVVKVLFAIAAFLLIMTACSQETEKTEIIITHKTLIIFFIILIF